MHCGILHLLLFPFLLPSLLFHHLFLLSRHPSLLFHHRLPSLPDHDAYPPLPLGRFPGGGSTFGINLLLEQPAKPDPEADPGSGPAPEPEEGAAAGTEAELESGLRQEAELESGPRQGTEEAHDRDGAEPAHDQGEGTQESACTQAARDAPPPVAPAN